MMKTIPILLLSLAAVTAAGQTPLRVAFIDPALPKNPPPRNAAALAFAQSQGGVAQIAWQKAGGWLAADGRVRAPEEFDVVWFHQGDDLANAKLDTAAGADLMAWLEGGGALLLSGAAGHVLNDLSIEPTPLRVLGATEAAYVSGIRVLPKHREHPAFAGLDVTRLVSLTTKGGNALADFHGTAGPSGELLANGSGAGERPLVEYTVGAGRVIFVGWRLPDFTTATDAHRPNLERLFGNLLRYLASKNANHARLVAPPGKSRYERRMGLPFLLADKTVELSAAVNGEKTAVSVEADVRESAVSGERVTAKALGLTLTRRERPVAQFVAARRTEQEAVERKDREAMAGLRVIKPDVKLLPAPLTPLVATNVDQSVLLGRSPFMAPGDGKGDITPVYEPVEDGGFRIKDSKRKLNRPIVHGQNRVWTGDVPLFRMDTVTGIGSYAKDERVFPLWARPDAHIGGVVPSMGTLRLGVPGAGGKTNWLDEQSGITTTFHPGYTEYVVAGMWEGPQRPDSQRQTHTVGALRPLPHSASGCQARVTIAPTLDFHGFVCRVEFDKKTPLLWQYGGIWWQSSEANSNRVEFADGIARITEPNLPNGLALVACDIESDARAVTAAFGQQAEFVAKKPRRVYHIVATWGITRYDGERARKTMARLDTPNTAAWPEKRDELKKLWFDCHIGRALEPEKNIRQLVARDSVAGNPPRSGGLRSPNDELRRTRDSWDARRAEFQIRTPDAHLNALINWARCVSEYHRQGPGLVLGGQTWQMYSHISTGWYGKQWAGDHAAMEECLRFYGAMQADNGFIRWISPSLVAFNAENNTAYWVDQVWRHYQWTGDRQFVRDLWPAVRKAVAWMRATNDPDGDGLFRDAYEYWNCDSNGKGPKSAAPSAMSWAMLDRAARMAALIGDAKAEAEYRALVEKTRAAIFRELWNEKEGRLGCIGSDGIWRGHPQTWEEYLAINAGLFEAGPAPLHQRARHPHAEREDYNSATRQSSPHAPREDSADRVFAGAASRSDPATMARRAMRWIASHYGFEPQRGVKLLACSDWWPIRWSCQWVPTGDTCLAVLAGMKSGDADLWWPYLKTVVGSAFRSEFPGINMGISNAGAGGGDREDVDSDDPHMHVAVRGLFGIEPALQEGRLEIRPAFPSDWREASIRTPDLSYEWKRDGERATFRIRTAKPVVKRVRANLDGEEIVTPAEMESVIHVAADVRRRTTGPQPTNPPPYVRGYESPSPILAEQQPPPAPRLLTPAERSRLVLFDLAPACNVTSEEFVATKFTFDYTSSPMPLSRWWGNPTLTQPPSPRVLTATNGVVFLTAGRPKAGLGTTPKNMLALASWQPHPLPGGATIAVGQRCERLWLLLQSYVHPMKNYLPNGEVVLRYADGKRAITSLIPPFNFDCYFQHFSREGVAVPLGQLGPFPAGWTPIHRGLASAHADTLAITCDASRVLESVELRATCSEAVIGLAGMTALSAEGGKP